MALAGIAAAEDGYTFTTTNSSNTTVTNFWCNGFAVNLDSTIANSRVNTTSTVKDINISDYNTVSLTSVTVNIRDLKGTVTTENNVATSGITLALTNSNGTILALSDNFVSGTGSQTWTFSNTQVSTKESLYFVYTASANERIQVGYTLQTGGTGFWEDEGKQIYRTEKQDGVDVQVPVLDGEGNPTYYNIDMIMCGAASLIDYTNTNGVSSLAFLGSNTSRDMVTNRAQYAPMISIQTVTIPEPTTATLSLLALAGLAARRRRK